MVKVNWWEKGTLPQDHSVCHLDFESHGMCLYLIWITWFVHLIIVENTCHDWLAEFFCWWLHYSYFNKTRFNFFKKSMKYISYIAKTFNSSLPVMLGKWSISWDCCLNVISIYICLVFVFSFVLCLPLNYVGLSHWCYCAYIYIYI